MALAATGSVDLAEQVSSATGYEMKLAGINWVYRYVVTVLQRRNLLKTMG
jgi:beta-N-acetylhexosaminidase